MPAFSSNSFCLVRRYKLKLHLKTYYSQDRKHLHIFRHEPEFSEHKRKQIPQLHTDKSDRDPSVFDNVDVVGSHWQTRSSIWISISVRSWLPTFRICAIRFEFFVLNFNNLFFKQIGIGHSCFCTCWVNSESQYRLWS